MDLKLLRLFRSCCVSPPPIQAEFARRGMPWRYVALVLLSLCCAASLPAQFVDASSAGEPVKLTAMWRFHRGDNPAWSAPAFDDSQWYLMAPDKDTKQQADGADTEYGWYRIRVKLPATQQPLALTMGPVPCEVYADGKLVGTVGKGTEIQAMDRVNVMHLPQSLNGRIVTLAVRTMWTFWETEALSEPPFEPSLAPARLQWQLREAASNKRLLQGAPGWFSDALALSLGTFSLGLFLLRRRSTEYGWVALAYIPSVVWHVAVSYLDFHHVPWSYRNSLVDAMADVVVFATAMYVWEFIGARRGRLFVTAMVLIGLDVLVSQLEVYYVVGDLLGSQKLGALVGNTVALPLLEMIIFLILVRMGISAWQGNRNAQLLLIPVALQWSLQLLTYVPPTLILLGVVTTPWTFAALQVGQATVTWIDIFTWLSMACMALILIIRFTRSSEREQRLSSELETARRVQAQLVPAELPGTRNFRFEAVYRSASEVGGDLYQVYPRLDGSVMVLVGDVSGKGLKAAMLGTLVVGAAGAIEQEQPTPAGMLSRLNRRLCGASDGGFVTCLCCLIAPDGRLTLSNAGHLAPYRNGEEVPSSSGLPLGLVAAAEYVESRLQLQHGDTLTFISDGVVEARNAQGELFGFSRTQAISAEPARTIADKAVAFGQEDDITVLSISLSAIQAAL